MQIKRNSLTLYQKILVSILTGSFVFLTAFTLAVYYSNEVLEDHLFTAQVNSEFTSIKTKLEQLPNAELPKTELFSIYLESRLATDPLPAFFKEMDLDVDYEYETSDVAYHVYKEEWNNDVIYVIYNMTSFEKAEKQLGLILFIGWLIFLGVIFIFSRFLSRMLSQPIQQLQAELSDIPAHSRGVTLSSKYNNDEIGKIAQAFDRYSARMDDYVTKQMAFSAMASHELRSPLTIVQTSADLIACLHQDDLTLEHTQKIQQASNSLADLTQALLTVTRDKHERDSNEPVKILELLDHLEKTYTQELNIKGIKLIKRVDPKYTLSLDATLLSVVLSNLIKNAIKFSNENDITIQLEHRCLKVIDAGVGIESEDIDQVFEFKFKGLNSQGYGIGLYITKMICDHQLWDLKIYKNPLNGITTEINF